jgi:hypothetical protein
MSIDATFNSCRDAVAYALSHRKGPQAARPSMGKGPKGYRSAWDGCAVRACMVRAGIHPDSPEEMALELWAQGRGPKPSKAERRLRKELDAHGLLKRPTNELTSRRDLAVVTWVDPETGLEMSSKAAARGDEE